MKEATDSINVELTIQAVQMDVDNIWMQGDIEILINGERPYAEIDFVDFEAFLESPSSNGEFFIFSCICGVAECGGRKKGIKVSHRENTVAWENGNTGEAWLLDRNNMEDDLNKIRPEVLNYKRYFSEKGIGYVGVGYNW